MIYLIKNITLSCLLIFYGNLLFAESFASPQEFKNYIKNIILESSSTEEGEKLEVTILQFNTENNLPYCKSKFQTSLGQSGSSSTNTVVLSCIEKSPYTVYIPVQLKLMVDMVAAAHRIMPGDIITEKDVFIEKFDKYQVYHEYFQEPTQVINLVASRLIAPRSIIFQKSVAKPKLVKKNQSIALVLREGPIEVSMAGVAQMDGYINDTIKILNPSSKKIVEGIVTGYGTVEIL